MKLKRYGKVALYCKKKKKKTCETFIFVKKTEKYSIISDLEIEINFQFGSVSFFFFCFFFLSRFYAFYLKLKYQEKKIR